MEAAVGKDSRTARSEPSGGAFQRLSLARRNGQEQQAAERMGRPFEAMSAVQQAKFQRPSSQALRCDAARSLKGGSLRDFGCRLSESTLLRWFCKLDRIDTAHIPTKSALQRYGQRLAEKDMRR